MKPDAYTEHHLPTTPAPPEQWDTWRTALRAHAFAVTPVDPDRPYEVEVTVATAAFDALFAATRRDLIRAARSLADGEVA